MPRLLGHPLIAATAPAVRRDLGVDASTLLAELPADADVRAGWALLWQTLAAQRPDRFLIAPARLQEFNPTALAFLYARRTSHPRTLPLLETTGAEQRALRRARSAVRPAGVDLHPARCYVVGPRLPLLAEIVTFEQFTGVSFAQERALRRHVLLCGRHLSDLRRAHAHADVAALILHEELHGAIGAAADATPGSYHDRLVCCVDEAATTVLELWGMVCAEDGRPTAAKLKRRAAGNCYRRQARRLIDLLAQSGPVDTLAQRCAELAVANLRGASGARTAAALSTLDRRTRTSAQWLADLGPVD